MLLASVFEVNGDDPFATQLFWFVMAALFSYFSYKASRALPTWVESYHVVLSKIPGYINSDTGIIKPDAELDIEDQQKKGRTGSAARWRQRLLIFCVVVATMSWCCFLFST